MGVSTCVVRELLQLYVAHTIETASCQQSLPGRWGTNQKTKNKRCGFFFFFYHMPVEPYPYRCTLHHTATTVLMYTKLYGSIMWRAFQLAVKSRNHPTASSNIPILQGDRFTFCLKENNLMKVHTWVSTSTSTCSEAKILGLIFRIGTDLSILLSCTAVQQYICVRRVRTRRLRSTALRYRWYAAVYSTTCCTSTYNRWPGSAIRSILC